MQPLIHHNRVYSLLLLFFVPVCALNAAGLFHWHFAVGPESLGHLPARFVPWVALANLFYCLAMAVTWWQRRVHPQRGRQLTRLLNWALLPAVPGGTLLALYGWLKVDKAE